MTDPFKEVRQAKDELKGFATEYTFLTRYKIIYTGRALWGVYENHSRCSYNKTTGDFDYEPMPSSRDQKFYHEHRFTLAECKKIIEKLIGDVIE